MEVRGVFEGVWWVAILRAFNVGFGMVVSLILATNRNKTWFAITNSESNGIPSGSGSFTIFRRTAPEAHNTFSLDNRRRLAHWTSSDDFTEQQTEGRPRA
jgi:hypothetical protein